MASSYIFSETQFQSELERLQALEKVSDPASQRQILATGLTTGWKCLEVGAGAGSIMRWMSEKVGSSGSYCHRSRHSLCGKYIFIKRRNN